MTRGRWTPLALVVCTLALVGCGGGRSGVDAATYVKSICGTLTSWKADVESAGGQLHTASNSAKSLVEGKQQYVVFLNALVAATGQAAAGLKAAGVPSVHNGNAIATSLQGAFTRARASLAQAAARARHIPTNNAGEYQAATSGVTDQFKQSLSSIGTLTPKNTQLDAAAAKDPTCNALTTG